MEQPLNFLLQMNVLCYRERQSGTVGTCIAGVSPYEGYDLRKSVEFHKMKLYDTMQV